MFTKPILTCYLSMRPPPVYMTQSIHILREGTHAHMHPHTYRSDSEQYNRLDLAITKRLDPCQQCRNRFLNQAFASLRKSRTTPADSPVKRCRRQIDHKSAIRLQTQRTRYRQSDCFFLYKKAISKNLKQRITDYVEVFLR